VERSIDTGNSHELPIFVNHGIGYGNAWGLGRGKYKNIGPIISGDHIGLSVPGTESGIEFRFLCLYRFDDFVFFIAEEPLLEVFIPAAVPTTVNDASGQFRLPADLYITAIGIRHKNALNIWRFNDFFRYLLGDLVGKIKYGLG